jgi:hypothetical protein
VGKSEGKRPLEDPGIDGREILKWIIKKCDRGVDWINEWWQAVVNVLVNLWVP